VPDLSKVDRTIVKEPSSTNTPAGSPLFHESRESAGIVHFGGPTGVQPIRYRSISRNAASPELHVRLSTPGLERTPLGSRMKYYKLAEKYDLPVIVHTGDNWSTTAKVKYAHPLRMDEVAVDFPQVRFILAHFGNPWLVDAAEVLFKNDKNVWADLSGLAVGSEKEIQALLGEAGIPDSATGLMFSDLKKAMAYVGDYKKFLYGSDWPLAPMASYRRLIESLIPKQHHQDVFRENAKRVFKV
jgi:predicted TIM-barrel fold metal-dependent hydrolase